MNVAILCAAAIIIAAFIERKSVVLTITHSAMVILLLVFSLFTADEPLFIEGMQNIFGESGYEAAREALYTPGIFLYSGATILIIIEIVMSIISFIAVGIHIVKIKRRNKREIKAKDDRMEEEGNDFPVRVDKIYLRLCRLLN